MHLAAWRPLLLATVAVTALAPAVEGSTIAVGVTQPAEGDAAAVSVTGNASATCLDLFLACAPSVAASGTMDAEGGVAVAGGGDASSSLLSVSLLHNAESETAAITLQGGSEAKLLALSVMGDAECQTARGCYAVSLLGEGSTLSGCTILRKADLSAFCGTGGPDVVLDEAFTLLN